MALPGHDHGPPQVGTFFAPLPLVLGVQLVLRSAGKLDHKHTTDADSRVSTDSRVILEGISRGVTGRSTPGTLARCIPQARS